MDVYIPLLLIIPIIFSILFLFSKNETYYKVLSVCLFLVSTTISVILLFLGPQSYNITGRAYIYSEGAVILFEALIIFYLIYVTVKNKRYLTLSLTVVQILLTIYSVFFMGKNDSFAINIDKLSLIMITIVNVIGTLILIFANDYISTYEHHRNMKSRQKLFYFMICIFLSAMNGLVISDTLTLMYLFWEITTIVSFVLISYNNDAEAKNSGFRALSINILGGICFSLGIILFKNMLGFDSLSQIIENGQVYSFYTLPVFLLCMAGFTKSAQVPFQSWLLGAMVAPTPVSALLHSSTMVKAGVFLIVKLSPAYAGTWLGVAIAIYGAFTFFICSALAISQRNAKRVLAYSTIANLGLIVSSCGLGTTVAVSAAIMLIIYHAISKALLFLCAGQIEHVVSSRDIEEMSGLISIAPTLATLSALGMFSMLLPPFGVLITKWISIEASAHDPIVAVFLVLGSALTTVYYLKWVGTILTKSSGKIESKENMSFFIKFPLVTLGTLISVTAVLLTPIFNYYVSPEVTNLLKVKNELIITNGFVSSSYSQFNETFVFIVLGAGFVIYLLVRALVFTPTIKKVYMCGENNVLSDGSYFRCMNGITTKANVSSLYLDKLFNESKITFAGNVISIGIIATVFIGGISCII